MLFRSAHVDSYARIGPPADLPPDQRPDPTPPSRLGPGPDQGVAPSDRTEREALEHELLAPGATRRYELRVSFGAI